MADIPGSIDTHSALRQGYEAREVVVDGHDYPTLDNGQRDEFNTGSRRDTRRGKGRFDLIWSVFIRRLAALMERGAEKYGDWNWSKGQPVMRSVDSLLRHTYAVVDRMDDEDHLAAIAFNAMSIMYVLAAIKLGKLPPELDDRP